MQIAVIKEQKEGEGRVAATPENVRKMVEAGNEVLVEKDAGIGAGFTNEEYVDAGGKLVSHEGGWKAKLIIKVKEPDPEEYKYFSKGKIVWGFQHLASSKPTVEAMMKAGTTAIGGETIVKDGKLELLAPMSAIAGRRSVIMGAYYLEAQHQGQGILLPGIPGIDGGNVVIFGGGNAAINAATLALNMGCSVVIIELNDERIKFLQDKFAGKKFRVVKSNEENLAKEIKDADIFISTILIPGSRPPKLVKEYMVKSMKPGSVLVDVAIDQGGTVETIDHPTTIDDPIFVKDGIIHYAVPNQPGAVPRTATMALAKGNLSYLLEIADKGINEAIKTDKALASGVNLFEGKVTNKGLADSLDLPYTELSVDEESVN
ncbi:alanine dehydrogenase [Companilactobacillus paralimentarius DSM 13238 = JCM 10415]|uniref:Alanine dehydrogenase n=1 Tax=Companilactobacillus paralimentarius DSM 13238 = JCM 10415 TaxID=1122151 RepID=A0A0R1P7Q5_9LACO|nr:alanine dehydrogenase [Companilactobacillus paralimentarius]KAE9561925.1 alanine dehydrogenase [Companilactobacillus paralimentarius]KRL28217.1 alanine dehydrogenase [Companilactobacillus paralimentarius DSM 13238 = JCM 10415]QFR68611.1 alanine dehydrogenase [Companilactobacillus paralimentarius]